MIELTLIDAHGGARILRVSPFFRITGPTVWTAPGEGDIVRLTSEGWDCQGQVWAGMRFQGLCRLVMGLPREPTGVSEILQSVSIVGDVLSANGIPFAVFERRLDMWRSVIADTWWHAFRIEAAQEPKGLLGDASDERATGTARDPSSDFGPHLHLN